jgi:hypothetical protein
MTQKLNITSAAVIAAVGAAAGAATVALSDKNNRKKFGKVVASVAKEAQEIGFEFGKNSKPLRKTAGKIGKSVASDAKKAVRKNLK